MPSCSRAVLRAAVLALGLSACSDTNLGLDPPSDALFFPGGLLLDPRAPADEPARYLLVANGNNDLSYNAGSVVAIDLDDFFAAWARPGTYEVDPWCGAERCVQYVGSDTTADRPCRRLALRPNVVECDEQTFIPQESIVQVGDFATLLTSSCELREGEGEGGRLGRCLAPRVWLPVRGDPSITYIDLGTIDDGTDQPDWEKPPGFDCGQPDPDVDPFVRCSSRHRLTHLFNDRDLPPLGREPFTMLMSPSQRLAFVAHADGDQLTTIDLGEYQKRRPQIVGQAGVFFDPNGLSGGFGLAERPCDPADAPSITEGCTRPLVYGSFRYTPLLASFTVEGVELQSGEGNRRCLEEDEDLELGDFGVVPCSQQVRSVQRLFPGGLDPQSTSIRPVLGDIAFGDASGNELFVVQTNPAALLKLDTSVGPDGAPLDIPSAPPIELCEEPTRLRLFEDGGQRYAFVSCFRAAEIFVLDLDAFRVIDTIRAGTGPWEIEVDPVRQLLYVANSLERSISVIDLGRDRPTRFEEIARIGLQEPFSR